MKARIFLAAIMTLGMMAFTYAQEPGEKEMQTLFSNNKNKLDNGGYGAITIGYTQIDNENVMTLGGRAGWLIDHHVTLGLAGTAFVNSIEINGYWEDDPNSQQEGYYLVGGYGGFFVEPIIAPNFPIHVSFPILIGGGGLALNYDTWHEYDDWDYDYYEPYDWDSYWVFEPGVEIELNIVKFFRVSFGATYRLTSNLHMNYAPKDMLNGFSGNVSLKFGKF